MRRCIQNSADKSGTCASQCGTQPSHNTPRIVCLARQSPPHVHRLPPTLVTPSMSELQDNLEEDNLEEDTWRRAPGGGHLEEGTWRRALFGGGHL